MHVRIVMQQPPSPLSPAIVMGQFLENLIRVLLRAKQDREMIFTTWEFSTYTYDRSVLRCWGTVLNAFWQRMQVVSCCRVTRLFSVDEWVSAVGMGSRRGKESYFMNCLLIHREYSSLFKDYGEEIPTNMRHDLACAHSYCRLCSPVVQGVLLARRTRDPPGCNSLLSPVCSPKIQIDPSSCEGVARFVSV